MAARQFLVGETLQVPERFNFARDIVDVHAVDPVRPAMIWLGDSPDDRRSLTFLQISHLSCRLANMLADRGITKGDRVFLMVPRRPEWWIAMVAAPAGGCRRSRDEHAHAERHRLPAGALRDQGHRHGS